jgi:hypothetical protein
MSKKAKAEVTITIPPHALPLLNALAAIRDETIEQVSARAVLHWLQSDDAMERIDEEVNILLRKV